MGPPLLFLSHRVPYPPDRGDKIRSFHILKELSKHFRIFLGAMSESEQVSACAKELSPYVEQAHFVTRELTTARKIWHSLLAFIQFKPISFACFYSDSLQHWVRNTVTEHNIKHIFVYCSSMAQYVESNEYKHCRRVIDFIDVDSEKWRQLAALSSPILKLVFNREYSLVRKNEQRIAKTFDAYFFVSQQETTLFTSLNRAIPNNAYYIENGVDANYMSPDLPNPISPVNGQYIVFTGTMDAQANINAIEWFITNVWEKIRVQLPNLKVVVVGRNPVESLLKYANASILFTHEVPDVRTYLCHAECVIAPMLVARGIQNKVLEAMAMKKALCLTSGAAEGITLPDAQQRYISDDSTGFAENLIALISNKPLRSDVGKMNRKWVIENYSWDKKLENLQPLVFGME